MDRLQDCLNSGMQLQCNLNKCDKQGTCKIHSTHQSLLEGINHTL